MAKLTSLDDVVAGALPIQPIVKASLASQVAGGFASLFQAAGIPAAGANPPASGAGVTTIPDKTTAGALLLPTIAGGLQAYLAQFALALSVAGSVWLFDRLAHVSGLSGIVTTAQPTVHNALTRWTTDNGLMCVLEVYTALGATGVTASVSYTNESGVAGRTGTIVIPASTAAGRFIPMTLQAGDKGVRSVQSVTMATTGTAGNFGLTIAKVHAILPAILANVGVSLDAIGLNAQEIDVNACLMLAVLCSTTSSGVLSGSLGITTK
jgi:hypothetical protein